MKVVLKSVTKKFRDLVVVDNISLVIPDGELFFLLGPSGCGKTTLLRCVAGFYVPDRGTIMIGDTDVTHVPPHQRDTAMVFQSYALWPHMTVRENVAFGLELRKVPKDEMKRRVSEALAMVKMSERAHDKPNQLSGGQQQRIALARALVIHPKCLLLDEPLSNLDAKLRLEMRSEIRRICKEAGLTAIYVTHDQKEALSIADRLAVLHDGKLQRCGKPQEVYLHPNTRFVANFIGETNFIEGIVTQSEARKTVVKTEYGCIVSTAPPAGPVTPGGPVTLSLRPEVIRLGNPPAEAVNVFEGSVHNTVYLGEVAQHQVNLLANGQVRTSQSRPLKVYELHPKIVAQDDKIERADVWFGPEDVILLTQ